MTVRHRILPPPEAARDFVAGPDNPAGMRVDYYDLGDRIEGVWTVTPQLEGWAGLAQATAFAALHDMTGIYTCAVLAEEFGFTTRMEIRFVKPLRLGDGVRTEGCVAGVSGRTVAVESRILTDDGAVASTAGMEIAAGDAALFTRMLRRPLSPFTEAYLAAPKGRRREMMRERGAGRV